MAYLYVYPNGTSVEYSTWTNPQNAHAADGVDTTRNVAPGATDLHAWTFPGATLPPGATFVGVHLELDIFAPPAGQTYSGQWLEPWSMSWVSLSPEVSEVPIATSRSVRAFSFPGMTEAELAAPSQVVVATYVLGGTIPHFMDFLRYRVEYEGGAAEPGAAINAWNGSTWDTGELKRWDGEAWVPQPLKRWDGTDWV